MRFLDRLIMPRSRQSTWDPLGVYTTFAVGGSTYDTLPVQMTLPGQKSEPIGNSFAGYAAGGLFSNSVIFGLTATRIRVFAEARFQYQRFNNGRPGDLWGDPSLRILEQPWPGGTTGDLLSVMLLHADYGGSAYVTMADGQLVMLRPDWVEIVLAQRTHAGADGKTGPLGMEKVGYVYWQDGKMSGADPVVFLADDVAHFAPQPDPLAWYRGMSWLTPVVREIQTDGAANAHKLKFFENAATPNLAVSLKEISDPELFDRFVDKMDAQHAGWENAYKTLYMGAGADVTVIGCDPSTIDFKSLQGFGETRLALAAGVPPTVACLSEGLQGSSLNAGNFGQARRQFADTTMSSLWRNAAGSLAVLVSPPDAGSRLWYDARDVPFLREDQADQSQIQAEQAAAIRQLVEAGYDPESVVAAISANDITLLTHSGMYSVQLQAPGAMEPEPQAPPALVEEPAEAAPRFDAEWLDYQQRHDARVLEALRNPPQVTVAPAQVNVHPPAVTVEAPQVTVHPPAITVESPEVNVEVRGPSARRVERDEHGEIVRVIDEEENQ